MTSRDLNIGVLESRWHERANYSVRSFFELYSHLYTQTIDGFLYERFASKRAFSDTIKFVIGQRRIHFLYIASHGAGDHLEAANKEKIKRSEIRNDICHLEHVPNSTLHGLFIGACDFGTNENAEFLLDDCTKGKNPLTWFAGYEKSVDWVDSSALDFMFWHQLFWSRRKQRSHLTRIKKVAKDISTKCPGLIRDLGFHVFTRKKGPAGGINDLVATAYE